MRALGGFEAAKNIDPQWSADGRSLFFISDRQGISNVYRMDADGGNVTQVTNLLTGATGITDLSPGLSVAGTRVAFSVYEEDGYNIYALDTTERHAQPLLYYRRRYLRVERARELVPEGRPEQ